MESNGDVLELTHHGSELKELNLKKNSRTLGTTPGQWTSKKAQEKIDQKKL